MLETPKNAIIKKSTAADIEHAIENSIDFIELVFDDIVDNKKISNRIKVLLLRLQIPIIKALIYDKELFTYSSHPAIILLNTIADTCVGAVEYTSDTYKLIDKIITNILSEYELDVGTFQSALNILNNYIANQDTKAETEEPIEKSSSQRKSAREVTLKSLRTATTGKILPVEVHSLILKRWPTLMFNHYLANGRDNDEWTMIILTLRQIIDSVQPITSFKHLKKIKLTKDALFRQTENHLHTCISSNNDIKNVITAYKSSVNRQIKDATLMNDNVIIANTGNSDTKPASEPVNKKEAINRPTIPPNIMPGMWFQLFMGEGKAIRHCKLSVILVEDANLMFVNHRGELVIEKSFDEFNKEIANKISKVIMGHSIFESSFKTYG
jgi:hypothetical protein